MLQRAVTKHKDNNKKIIIKKKHNNNKSFKYWKCICCSYLFCFYFIKLLSGFQVLRLKHSSFNSPMTSVRRFAICILSTYSIYNTYIDRYFLLRLGHCWLDSCFIGLGLKKSRNKIYSITYDNFTVTLLVVV